MTRSRYSLRYFIDGATSCKSEHTFDYTHAARMIIPRIGERVWLNYMLCVEVDMVTYSPNHDDDGDVYLVDIDATDITEEVMDECEEDF